MITNSTAPLEIVIKVNVIFLYWSGVGISIDGSTVADFSPGVVKCSHIQCKEKLQLCVTIVISPVSLAVEIFHPIMLVKLNSAVVALETQNGEIDVSKGIKLWRTCRQKRNKLKKFADFCMFP